MSYTNIVTCWIILNKNKEYKRKGKIQFIDLSGFVKNIDRRNSTISDEGVNNAIRVYNEMEENDISFILDIKNRRKAV